MKKTVTLNVILLLTLALALTFTLSSCKKTENALLLEFKTMTAAEPTYRGLEKAVSFMDANIDALPEESASRFVLAYEDFLLRFLKQGNIDVQETSGKEVFIYTEYEEGIASKVVDYQAMIEKYSEKISFELVELLNIKASEVKAPAMKDAALQITYEALLERTFRTENLLTQHGSEDALKTSALDYYKSYLFLLFAGSDNSPVFDYQTGEFSPDAKEAYETFMIAHPETVLASALTEYFAYLNSIKYTIDYTNATENKVFYDTCNYLIDEAAKSF